jgi:hypothetical protein
VELHGADYRPHGKKRRNKITRVMLRSAQAGLTAGATEALANLKALPKAEAVQRAVVGAEIHAAVRDSDAAEMVPLVHLLAA